MNNKNTPSIIIISPKQTIKIYTGNCHKLSLIKLLYNIKTICLNNIQIKLNINYKQNKSNVKQYKRRKIILFNKKSNKINHYNNKSTNTKLKSHKYKTINIHSKHKSIYLNMNQNINKTNSKKQKNN